METYIFTDTDVCFNPASNPLPRKATFNLTARPRDRRSNSNPSNLPVNHATHLSHYARAPQIHSPLSHLPSDGYRHTSLVSPVSVSPTSVTGSTPFSTHSTSASKALWVASFAAARGSGITPSWPILYAPCARLSTL